MRTDEADGAACQKSPHDAFSSNEAVFGVCALEKFIEKKENGRVIFGEVADVAQARDLRVKARAAFLEGVVDENAGAYLQRCELQTTSAYRGTGHGEDSIDADGAHERAFAGHVGAADEKNPGFSTYADVVANAFSDWDEGMAKLLGVEAGRAFDEFGEGIGGVLVTIAGEGEERLDFARCLQP